MRLAQADIAVLSIVASPTLSSDVRNKATHMLKSLYGAYTTDKTDPKRKSASAASTALPAGSAGSTEKTLEAQSLASELDISHSDSHIESVPVQTGTILRVHGIYMDRRRSFEIRVNDAGHLELYDAERRAKWDRKLEAEMDRAEKASRKKEEEQDKEARKLDKIEKEGAAAEKKSGSRWGWGMIGKGKKSPDEGSDGDDTDAEGDDGDSTSVMLDQEKEGEVTILERRPTLKERLDGLVHPTLDASGTPEDPMEAAPPVPKRDITSR
jgi:hypothetical protein